MTSCFATPPGQIPLEKGTYGNHLPADVAKSWKTVEHTFRQIAAVLRSAFEKDYPKIILNCSTPTNPTEFGYFGSHYSEEKARSALSESLDAFVVLFAYVSFCIAICRTSNDPFTVSLSMSTPPRWLRDLSSPKSRVRPEWLQRLVDSPIADFFTAPQRLGAIVNVARCSWSHLVPYLFRANVPIWFYWGVPPAFEQPRDDAALIYAPRSHPQSRAPALPVVTPSQPVSPRVPSAHAGPAQLPGETWKDFMIRQNNRRKARLSKENDAERQAREGREKTAAKKSCPGKKGPSVFVWEKDGGVWTRTPLARKEVEDYWGNYSSSQRIFNSIDNCWDLCDEFDAGTAGDHSYEYDSNDSDDDTMPVHRSGAASTSSCPPILVDSTPRSVPTPAQISSNCPPMLVDPTPHSVPTPAQDASDCPPMVVDPIPHPVPTPAQVASDCPPMVVDPTSPPISTPAQVAPDCSPILLDPSCASVPPSVSTLQLPNPPEGDFIDADENDDDMYVDEDPYDASRQVAYSLVPLDLEQVPVTTLDDLLYYRYGFSLSESPYSGIPASVKATRNLRSWTEVCRAVGGQHLESSPVVDKNAIQDFLSILAGCVDPYKDVPGKYWDLSPLGQNSIVDLTRVFISIEEKQFTNGTQYIIHPRLLHPSRNTPWLLSVDPMTALECIRRGLGPHTIDIANFLISRGVHFRALQHIPNSPNSEQPPVRPQRQYLGHRSVDYQFDLADFAGYEELRDCFLRSQSHGPLALREGGIIARLAREVLTNSSALSGPTSEALSGQRARFVCNDQIYVDDEFLESELGLICGTYVLDDKGIRLFFYLLQLYCH
jgi:hypothetical protein